MGGAPSSSSSSSSDDTSSSSSSSSFGWRKSAGLSRAVYKYEKKLAKHQRKEAKRMAKEQRRAAKKMEKMQRRAEKAGGQIAFVNNPSYCSVKQQQTVAIERGQMGKALFLDAYESGSVTVNTETASGIGLNQQHLVGNPSSPPLLQVLRPHLIDEALPQYASHGIIRVNQGEFVHLLDGSIANGLPYYNDYVLVRAADGRIGNVPRLCFI